MDRERAIEKLNDIRCHVKETSAEEQALVMAINALKAQLSKEGATSDMIDRQAVLDAIVQCTNCGDEDTLREYVLKHSLDNGWTGGILEALDAVKDLPPAQPEPQWIPCSEGIPKKTGYYICTCHDGVCYRTSVLKWSTGWVLTGARSYWKVIAWMPLPEPYTK